MLEDPKRLGKSPQKEQGIGIKKGLPTWKPASRTDVKNKELGYRYRWVEKSPDNIAKKEAENWEKVTPLVADNSSPTDDGKILSGKRLTSTHEKHDLILMRIDEDSAQQRDAYMNNKTKRSTLGLTAHIKNEMKGNNTSVHGNITISSLRGEQVID